MLQRGSEGFQNPSLSAAGDRLHLGDNSIATIVFFPLLGPIHMSANFRVSRSKYFFTFSIATKVYARLDLMISLVALNSTWSFSALYQMR